MKKTLLTIAIVLGLGLTTFAEGDNHQGGLFYRGAEPREYAIRGEDPLPMLPSHNEGTDQGAESPIGSGIVVLLGMGAAYLVSKKHREE